MSDQARSIAAFENAKGKVTDARAEAEAEYTELDGIRSAASTLGMPVADDFKERRTVFRDIGVTLRRVDRELRIARNRRRQERD